jgi:hypothetical protein
MAALDIINFFFKKFNKFYLKNYMIIVFLRWKKVIALTKNQNKKITI